IGDASINAVEVYAASHGISMMEALRRAEAIATVSPRARGSIARFVATLDSWTGSGAFLGEGVSGSLADLVERIITESGLRRMYETQARTTRSEADEARLDNLDELVSSAREFELEYDPSGDPAQQAGAATAPPLLAMLRAYLESVSLVADADAVDPAQGAVTL